MIKIAMIGAGSVGFSRSLTGDILVRPEFKNVTLAYMDIDRERLDVTARMCRKVARAVGAKPRIEATTNRRQALRGADFVINTVGIGGLNAMLLDFEIPRKYGLRFTVADTTGPGGMFRALRTYPMLTGLCADMMELCPDAWLLNYTNPMSMNMQTVYRTSSVKGVGLCHSVQGSSQCLAECAGVKPEEVNFVCAGINHMAFFLKFRKGNEDLYPRIFKAIKDPVIYMTNKIRFEIMKRLGYFPTESMMHHAEYSQYFIPHGPEFCARYTVPLDEYLHAMHRQVDAFDHVKREMAANKPITVRPSFEYGSTIIHSVATDHPSVVYGNMPNRGSIANLSPTAIVEVPTLVDGSGLHHVNVGEIPPQVVGYIQPHVLQHELFIRAATEGRRDHVYQAVMNDPLTAATLTLDQIVAMCDELIAAHGDALPPLDARKSLVPTSGKKFPKVDQARFRKQWIARQDAILRGAIKDWFVIGPFAGKKPNRISLDLNTPVEREFRGHADGAMDTKGAFTVDGRTLRWAACRADQHGFVDCDKALGHHEFCVAYGYATFKSARGGDAVLYAGSDDGNRIWVNGEQVHSLEATREFSLTSDEVKVRLRKGVNHLFIKLTQERLGWGFGVGVGGHAF